MTNKNNERVVSVSASNKYDVIIGESLIKNAGEHLKKVVSASKIAVVTDDVVDAIYGEKLTCSLKESGYNVVKFVFKNGEQSKNLVTYGKIVEFLAENAITRTDAIVALGGGVVGDMAGFAAATYLRGIKYVQIPTTLLSQIDSSVGGKTAVDLEKGKNLVGAFYQPALVLCDTGALDTLPKEIFVDGMGETLKYALLDKKVFDIIEKEEFFKGELVQACVDYKRRIVEQDEFEGSLRKVLNLGHTIAHAIEKLSDYNITHGKAVAIGLKVIGKTSFNHGYIDQNTLEKINQLISKWIDNVELPFSIEKICEVALNDKKRKGEEISLILIKGIGNVFEQKIKISDLKEYLA